MISAPPESLNKNLQNLITVRPDRPLLSVPLLDSLPDCLLDLVAYLISKRINEDK